MTHSPVRACLAAVCCVAVSSTPALADLYTGSLTSPVSAHALSASVDFELSGTTLTILLTNTSTQTSGFVPSDGISGVYFDVAGNPTLALVTTGTNAPSASNIWDGSAFDGTTNLSTYPSPKNSETAPFWDYQFNASGLGGGVTQTYGVSSAGLNIFQNVDGMPFNIFPTGFNGSNGNSPVNGGPVAVNATTLTLTGFTGSLSSISDIRFQYGTDLSDGSAPGVRQSTPEPASFAIWGAITLLGMAFQRWRRARA